MRQKEDGKKVYMDRCSKISYDLFEWVHRALFSYFVKKTEQEKPNSSNEQI